MPRNRGERGGRAQGRLQSRGRARGRGRGKLLTDTELTPSSVTYPRPGAAGTSRAITSATLARSTKDGGTGPVCSSWAIMEQDARAKASQTRKRVRALSVDQQSEYKRRKLLKECNFAHLPGAPSSRRNRIASLLGDPVPLPFAPGVPTELPAPLPPPWMRAKDANTLNRQLPRQMACSTPPPTDVVSQVGTPSTTSEMAGYTSSGGVPSPQIFVEVGGSGQSTPVLYEDLQEDAGNDMGSDVDMEEGHDTDTPIVYNNDAQTVSFLTETLTTEVTNILTDIDRTNDAAVRTLLPSDQFYFEWNNNLGAFRGVREPFTGIPGPTFPLLEMEPVDVFLKFWDDEIVDLIETETNLYADEYIRSGVSRSSRTTRWKPTNRAEIYTFFAVLIQQSVTTLAVEKEYWSSPSFLAAMPNWKTVLPYDRWLLLKKFLHFADNSSIPESLSLEQRRLYKIQPIIDHLNSKFQSLYLPNQNIALDESLLKWFGHLGFLQKIATKAAKAGIKSFEICESQTGYLWRFIIYAGKDSKRVDEPMSYTQTDEIGPTGTEQLTERDSNERLTETPIGQTDRPSVAPQGVTAKIVYDLASGLFNKGYTLVMDNYYNSPLLARCLKMNGMDCYGTLRLHRDSVPESMKSLKKTSMNTSNVLSSTSGDVNVIVWKDTGLVCMLSTYHASTVGITEKYGTAKFKPTVVLDYNKTMGGVDMKDQLLAGFPLERKRNLVWYKKLFRRLLNASTLNAYVIYRWKNVRIEHRDFRRRVSDGLLSRFFTVRFPRQIDAPVIVTRQLPGYLNKEPRPVLKNNHFNVKINGTSTKRKNCVWCNIIKHRKMTSYKRDVCEVPLCPECMKPYHTGVLP